MLPPNLLSLRPLPVSALFPGEGGGVCRPLPPLQTLRTGGEGRAATTAATESGRSNSSGGGSNSPAFYCTTAESGEVYVVLEPSTGLDLMMSLSETYAPRTYTGAPDSSMSSRHLTTSAICSNSHNNSSLDDGYHSDKSTSPSTTADDTSLPDMEQMMAVEEEEENESEEEEEELVPSTPTHLIPTIDQLFKRSFSQELAQLTSSSSSCDQLSEEEEDEQLLQLPGHGDQQLVILEDIQQILRDEANFELCV